MGRKRKELIDDDNEDMGDTRANRALKALHSLTVHNIVSGIVLVSAGPNICVLISAGRGALAADWQDPLH